MTYRCFVTLSALYSAQLVGVSPTRKNAWTKSERVAELTPFLTPRSPYWQMCWELAKPTASGQRGRGRAYKKGVSRSTRETDLSFARLVAVGKSEEVFRKRHYPEKETEPERTRMGPVIDTFIGYIETLGRSHDYIAKLRGRLAAR